MKMYIWISIVSMFLLGCAYKDPVTEVEIETFPELRRIIRYEEPTLKRPNPPRNR